MNDEPLTPEVTKAIDGYFALLDQYALPSPIGEAVQSIREQYKAKQPIAPTQIALLRRCFLRTRADQYEVDWLPVGYLEEAIAEELDGSPCRMLSDSDTERAIGWLALKGRVTDELRAWHRDIQDRLLLTGWLPQDTLSELEGQHQDSLRRWSSEARTMRMEARQ